MSRKFTLIRKWFLKVKRKKYGKESLILRKEIFMKWELIVKSIEDAIEKECFIPALALTLVIPDVCAKFEYPQEYKKSNGRAYIKWYNEYVYKYELVDFSNTNLDTNQLEEAKYFQDKTTLTGEYCWKLRCGLLHNGILDIDDSWSDKNNQEFVDFKFTVSTGTQYGHAGSASISTCSYNTEKRIEIELDLATFCKKILAIFKNKYLADETFLKDTENKLLKFVDLRFE